jgi:hypothetical protein
MRRPRDIGKVFEEGSPTGGPLLLSAYLRGGQKEISEGDAWRAADRCAANRTVPSVQRFPRANDSTSLIV